MMRVITTIIVLFFVSANLFADFDKVTTSDLSHFKRVYQSALRPESVAKTPARFTTRIRGFGRVRFIFDNIKVSTVVPKIITKHGTSYDTNPVVLLKGYAHSKNGKSRATATLAHQSSGLTLMTSFGTQARSNYEPIAISLEHNNIINQSNAATFKRTNHSALQNATCGTDYLPQVSVNFGQVHSPVSSSNLNTDYDFAGLKELEIKLFADSSYIAAHGSSSQYIQSRVNEVEAVYEDQFDLVFNIKSLEFDSTLNLGTTNAVTMLENFTTHLDNEGVFSSADLFHLFTGSNLQVSGNNSVIGIAYQAAGDPLVPGVVCKHSNAFTVGITERLFETSDELLKVTMAHEMGHNFGCEHVASGIMKASADSPLPTSFSAESAAVIENHIDTNGSCLAEATATPTPSGTTTPTPSGTPPPGGSDGVGGGGPDAVAVNLDASLNSDGEFTATMSLDEAPPSGCYLRLVVGQKRNRINYSNVLLAEELIDGLLSYTYTTTVNYKTFPLNRDRKPQKVFAAAFLDCDSASDSGHSPVRRLRSDLVNAIRSANFKKFAKHLKCRVGGSC